MEKSPARILGVTAALLACGAVFGALAAVVAAVLAFNITEGPPFSLYAQTYVFVAVVGAVLGGVLLPAACWLLLRRVPLGLAFLGTVLGTVMGAVPGWVLGHDMKLMLGPVGGAVLGFLLATILLRLRFSAPRPAGDRPIARPAGL
ncbi:MAG TPA: hypothetical protein VGB15_24395 [Longimicrobium sp.]|jgi:hypothetical protein